MAHMDIFQNDAFSMVSMTAAVEKTPYVPQFLRTLNIFEPEPIDTEYVSIEKRENVLALIQTSERGAPLAERSEEKRDLRAFRTVRLAKGETIQAREIQNIRAFGNESELQRVEQRIARSQVRLRADMELTHEHMRVGAIQGIVLDADGSTLINWFNEWSIAQPGETDFVLGTATTDVRGKCHTVTRAAQVASKGAWIEGVTYLGALTSDTFFDKLINHAEVKATYNNWEAAAALRENIAFRDFVFGGIRWFNYRGTDDGSTISIASGKAKFFPINAPGVFKVAQSPGESFDVVNTMGQEIYSMLIMDRDRNMWVRPELYSYPLYMCTRPEMLLRATTSN